MSWQLGQSFGERKTDLLLPDFIGLLWEYTQEMVVEEILNNKKEQIMFFEEMYILYGSTFSLEFYY